MKNFAKVFFLFYTGSKQSCILRKTDMKLSRDPSNDHQVPFPMYFSMISLMKEKTALPKAGKIISQLTILVILLAPAFRKERKSPIRQQHNPCTL